MIVILTDLFIGGQNGLRFLNVERSGLIPNGFSTTDET